MSNTYSSNTFGSDNGPKSAQEKLEEQKKGIFKQGGAEDHKRNRDNYTENLRKKKREEMFNKKRQHMAGESQESAQLNSQEAQPKKKITAKQFMAEYTEFPKNYEEFSNLLMNVDFELDDFPKILEFMASDNMFTVFFGLVGIRKLLSIPKIPPIQAVIDANLVPKIINYLQMSEIPKM